MFKSHLQNSKDVFNKLYSLGYDYNVKHILQGRFENKLLRADDQTHT